MKPAVFLALALAAAAADLSLIQPGELAARLPSKAPVMFHVGPAVLYRSHHIPGSIYVGMGASPSGIAALKDAAANLPRDREIVIYCGCCPWDHCPNIRPTFAVLKEMGFTKVKAMFSETSFKSDWIDHGYPVE